MIQRNKGVALWRQIMDFLEQEISSGSFKPGEKLPTEFELADRFRVNRHTARRALAGLQEKELIRVEQGRGTFVQEHVINYMVSHRTRFSENVIREKRAPSGILLGSSEEVATSETAEALYLKGKSKVTCLKILREADGYPVSFSMHYFPLPKFQGIHTYFTKYQSITASLHEYGLEDYTRQWTKITARMPSLEEASTLKQPKSRPVLITKSCNVDPRGIPIEYGIAIYASDWVQLVVQKD